MRHNFTTNDIFEVAHSEAFQKRIIECAALGYWPSKNRLIPIEEIELDHAYSITMKCFNYELPYAIIKKADEYCAMREKEDGYPGLIRWKKS